MGTRLLHPCRTGKLKCFLSSSKSLGNPLYLSSEIVSYQSCSHTRHMPGIVRSLALEYCTTLLKAHLFQICFNWKKVKPFNHFAKWSAFFFTSDYTINSELDLRTYSEPVFCRNLISLQLHVRVVQFRNGFCCGRKWEMETQKPECIPARITAEAHSTPAQPLSVACIQTSRLIPPLLSYSAE